MNILILCRDIAELRLLEGKLRMLSPGTVPVLACEERGAREALQGKIVDWIIYEAELLSEPSYSFLRAEIMYRDMMQVVLWKGDSPFSDLAEYFQGAFFLNQPLQDPEVDRVLRLALLELQQKERLRRLIEETHHWENHKKEIQQQFWERLLGGQISLHPTDFIREAGDCGIEIRPDDRFQMAILSRKLIRERNTEIERATRNVLLSLAERRFRQCGKEYFLLNQVRPVLIVRNYPKEDFVEFCKDLVADMEKERGIPLCIYYEGDILCENLFVSALNLRAEERESMEKDSGVFPAGKNQISPGEDLTIMLPGHFGELLKNDHHQQLMDEMRQILNEQSIRGNVSGSYLKALYMDIMQVVDGVLQEKGIPAHRIFLGKEMKELEANAHISIDNFLGWLEVVLQRIPTIQQLSFTETIRSYVQEHIREELTREQIAEAFNMNADYLGRVYKRETEESLGSYITRAKMEEAGRLLLTTGQSVGEIAMLLGYDNFSHFSKLFKKMTGFTPRDYRNHILAKKQNKE